MSRRMTDTGKWLDPWFRKLTPTAKLLWSYLCDNCDQLGIIELDVEGASFCIGAPITDANIEELKSRIDVKDGKMLLKKFIDFQCRQLSESCPAHKPVFAGIQKYGLVKTEEGYVFPNGSLPKGHGKPKDTLPPPKTEKPPPVIPVSLSSSVKFMELWEIWNEHLIEKKKRPTTRATKMQLKELEEMGVERAIIALKHSIAKSYTGIYEPNGVGASKPKSAEPNQIQEVIDVPTLNL